ncbi:glycosyltransferase 25 family member [Spodoptera litura]|uniref:Glycosyltransferase 25 family member n=1 Tax=Spodoptera litura TaxID=69820 RepID=A0A9J7J1D8_SPOLT|nr:glycosyltransferase 25 family member [Spodoptera litura]
MRAVVLTLLCLASSCCFGEDVKKVSYKMPTVGISVLVRNKAHTLPFFLSCIRNLNYPKNRIYLWIYSDFNEDKSIEILERWVDKYAPLYNGVYITTNSSSGRLHSDEKSPIHWSSNHFKHVISLREKALDFARKMWADYLFMIDADVFLTNPSTLSVLVSKDLPITAPMLVSDGLYSNFWCGMTDNYYYQRTDDYKPIQRMEKQGCYEVPMVHTAVLVHLRTRISDQLTYNPDKIPNYDGPEDDIIAFAVNAKKNGITLHICNDDLYGFVPVPLEDNHDPKSDLEQLLNIKTEAIGRGSPLPLDPFLQDYVTYPELWKFGCNEIYMINLERRTERRELMELSFKELGMDVKHFKAVDGRQLDMNNLKDLGVTLMPNYEDPYHKRPMKAGEVGCFLSHYYIWEEIAEKRHSIALVLEDDIHFVPYFRNRLLRLLREIKPLEWDLVYIGRKILQDAEEQYVTEHTTRPLYSYWTLGYLLSDRGARKLLSARPLDRMLPVDEFLPIMFDQHPNATWKAHFPTRNLDAYSAAPLLVHPTHYTGQEGYISDTEDSDLVTEITFQHYKNEL